MAKTVSEAADAAAPATDVSASGGPEASRGAGEAPGFGATDPLTRAAAEPPGGAARGGAAHPAARASQAPDPQAIDDAARARAASRTEAQAAVAAALGGRASVDTRGPDRVAETAGAGASAALPLAQAPPDVTPPPADESMRVAMPGMPMHPGAGGSQERHGGPMPFAPPFPVATEGSGSPAALSMAAPASVFTRTLDEAAGWTAPSLPPDTGAAVHQQIVRGMHVQLRQGGGDARIRLHPEHLGEVIVELRVQGDKVSATLRADTAAVRTWMAAHEGDLRAGLADLGLRLDELRVREREQGSREGSDAPPDQPRRRRARHDSSDDAPRFEVRA